MGNSPRAGKVHGRDMNIGVYSCFSQEHHSIVLILFRKWNDISRTSQDQAREMQAFMFRAASFTPPLDTFSSDDDDSQTQLNL